MIDNTTVKMLLIAVMLVSIGLIFHVIGDHAQTAGTMSRSAGCTQLHGEAAFSRLDGAGVCVSGDFSRYKNFRCRRK